jgi:hypothetical protein
MKNSRISISVSLSLLSALFAAAIILTIPSCAGTGEDTGKDGQLLYIGDDIAIAPMERMQAA